MNILIDFSGTCVLYNYPNRGADIKGAQSVLEELVQNGHNLILFNLRGDTEEELQDAVNWFRERGIKLFGVLISSPSLYGDYIISSITPGAPTLYNPHIAVDRFIDWKRMREILVEQDFIKEN